MPIVNHVVISNEYKEQINRDVTPTFGGYIYYSEGIIRDEVFFPKNKTKIACIVPDGKSIVNCPCHLEMKLRKELNSLAIPFEILKSNYF